MGIYGPDTLFLPYRDAHELIDDPRWDGYEVPPTSNANYGWILNIVSKLSQNGVAGFLLANGALSDDGTELKIRRQLIENNLVEAIIILPRNLFYTTGHQRYALSIRFQRCRKPPEIAQINPSPLCIWGLLDRPKLYGHSRTNYTVKSAKKTKKHIDIASMAANSSGLHR